MTRKSDGSTIFSLYFVTLGFMSLIYWNSILNVIDFFAVFIDGDFFTMLSFAFCAGQLLAFLLSPVLFSRISNKSILNLCAVMCIYLLACLIGIPPATSDLLLKKTSCTILCLLLGFFMASFQGKSFDLAGSISNKEIVMVNFGTGLSGVLTNLLAVAIAVLVPLPTDPADKNATIRNRTFIYGFIMIIFLALYFLIENLFLKRVPDFFAPQGDSRQPISDVEDQYTGAPAEPAEPVQDKVVIRRCLGPLTGLFFLLALSVAYVAYLVIVSCMRFDKNSDLFTIPFYMLFFNLADSIGKFIPAHLLLNSEPVMHAISAGRFVLYGVNFFIFKASGIEGTVLASPWIRVVICGVLGVSQGYLINSYTASCTNRFSLSVEKGRAGYYSVLFVIMGVLFGSICNLGIAKI